MLRRLPVPIGCALRAWSPKTAADAKGACRLRPTGRCVHDGQTHMASPNGQHKPDCCKLWLCFMDALIRLSDMSAHTSPEVLVMFPDIDELCRQSLTHFGFLLCLAAATGPGDITLRLDTRIARRREPPRIEFWAWLRPGMDSK